MLQLIVTCTEGWNENDIEGSRIRFYVRELKSKKTKELIHQWDIPIVSARRSLSLFNSKYSAEFEKTIDTLCQSYNIDKKNVTGFHVKKKRIEAGYKRFLKSRQSPLPKRTSSEYLKERRRAEKFVKKASPEIQELLKQKPIGTEE